jgi:hypothetical protein
MCDPYDFTTREAMAIQSAALRAVADYLDRHPTMIRAIQGEAADLLEDELPGSPSRWNAEDIAPTLFRIVVDLIASDPDTRAAVVSPGTGRVPELL